MTTTTKTKTPSKLDALENTAHPQERREHCRDDDRHWLAATFGARSHGWRAQEARAHNYLAEGERCASLPRRDVGMSNPDIQQLVREIEDMDLDAIRDTWRRRYGVPPALRSEPIMRMMLAWRVQTEAYGGIDAETRKTLARTGAAQPEGRELGIGAVLTRNWKGKEIKVVVETDGFRWEDELYPSLSAAATAIAGSRWNGPRFFGLRNAA